MSLAIEDFRKEFINDLRIEAGIHKTDTEDRFLENTFEMFREGEILTDPVRFYFGNNGRRNRMMQIYGYAYDEAESSLALIISDFKDSLEPRNLTKTEIDTLTKRMLAFLDEACNGDISQYCDDADETIQVAAEMKRRLSSSASDEIIKIKLIIVTNATLSSQVKSVKTDSFQDKPVDISIWTLESFCELEQNAMNEPVEIIPEKYGVDGIPCIKADLGDVASYEAYLAIIPGKLLADIYLEYGSKILEGNVRAYLGSNKVNTGILATVRTAPRFFFTYNNGIATTAKEVEVENTPSGLLIKRISNLQIINGGQTTASLATALIKKHSKDLAGVFVPMKLTIVSPEENEMSAAEADLEKDSFDTTPKTFEDRYQEMVGNISRFANKQTAVNESDLFSNHPFHIRMERMSLKSENWTPKKPGSIVQQTVWFYERARGKWNQAQFGKTDGEKKAFVEKHPKKQKITKEKFAKCLNTYMQKPHIVAKGSAACVKELSAYVLKEWAPDSGRAKFNDFYFRTSIVSAIIFDSTDRIINSSSWYAKGGCKAELVPYTIAKILSMIPSGKWIDIQRIWNEQNIHDSFAETIDFIGEYVYSYLQEKSGGALIRTVAQKEQTWKDLKAIPLNLPEEFIADLVDLNSIKEAEAEAKGTEKLMDEVSAQIKVITLGMEYWIALFDEGAALGLIDPDQAYFLNGLVGKISTGRINEHQAKTLLKFQKELEGKGIVVKK